MKRTILLIGTVFLMVLSLHPAQPASASVDATCTEHPLGPGPWNLNGTYFMRGQGYISCSANTGPIEVNVRLIFNGALLPVGTTTCQFDNYCIKTVYDSHLVGCFKVRVWGFIGAQRAPTGASTSPEACF